MGVWVSQLLCGGNKMKLSMAVIAVVLAVLISSCEGQKGGAKSAMRNRGRGGSGRGRSPMSRNNYGDGGNRGPDGDTFGNGTGRKACVGLCYLRKLQGKPPLAERKERPRACVGLCYLKKKRALRDARKGK